MSSEESEDDGVGNIPARLLMSRNAPGYYSRSIDLLYSTPKADEGEGDDEANADSPLSPLPPSTASLIPSNVVISSTSVASQRRNSQ